jgi:hypothetical protein
MLLATRHFIPVDTSYKPPTVSAAIIEQDELTLREDHVSVEEEGKTHDDPLIR